ncbi:MAG: PQQ-binding-like beta-propeller repeat protein [Planctomycetaceae bacterium]
MRRSSHFARFLCCCVAAVCADTIPADDWPQFLGPGRNGTSSETGLLQSLKSSSAKTLWQVPLGTGMAGIAISDGRAFTLFQTDAEQFAVALDAATGKQIWKTSLAPAYENSMGNGPRATPTVVAGRVFVYTGEGILSALNASDGKRLWTVNVPKSLGGQPSEYGCSCSPLVLDNLVIMQSGAENAATAAWDADTGKLVWKSGGSNAGYSSPVAAKLAGRQQVLVFNAAGVAGLDPKTGDQLWAHSFPTEFDCNTATPVVLSENELLISAGENHGAVILQLKASGAAIVAEPVWESLGKDSQLRAEWQTPVIHEGHLYALDNSGSAGPITNLVCIRISDRSTVWQKPRFGKSNLILADGRLWFTSMKGEVILVEASPKGYQESGRIQVLQTTRQAPALANGLLYVRDDEQVVCLDVRGNGG